MSCRGIKGATTAVSNTEGAILDATRELLAELLRANGLTAAQVTAIFFTCTTDLNAAFPARAARELSLTRVPLLCAQELEVPDGLARCIRVTLLAETSLTQEQVRHRYLRGAAALRPDLRGTATSPEAPPRARPPAIPAEVAIVGVGLIGGSLGIALRQKGARVVGIDLRPEVLARAIERGAVDAGSTDLAAIASAEAVILATPPEATLELAESLAAHLLPNALVTDVGSVKATVVEALRQRLPKSVRYVGGHPMFGTSARGVEAADASLLVGAPFLFTPVPQTEPSALAAWEALAQELGMRPVRLSPEEHDATVALLSHVPYLIASSLALAAPSTEAAGPAFQDMTRVAMSPPALWRSILSMNRPAVQRALSLFRAELDRLASLEGPELERALDAAQRKRLAMFPNGRR